MNRFWPALASGILQGAFAEALLMWIGAPDWAAVGFAIVVFNIAARQPVIGGDAL